MLMIKMAMTNTAAVPKALGMEIPSLARIKKWTAMVREEEKSEVGMRKALPAVKMTAAVSPMLRPTPRIMPVTMPGMAEGRTTLVTICHFVLPRE